MNNLIYFNYGKILFKVFKYNNIEPIINNLNNSLKSYFNKNLYLFNLFNMYRSISFNKQTFLTNSSGLKKNCEQEGKI